MLKIGNLTFTKKALKYCAFLGFVIGMPIGLLVAYVQDTGNTIPPVLLVFSLMAYNLTAFFLLSNKIGKNIIEVN